MSYIIYYHNIIIPAPPPPPNNHVSLPAKVTAPHNLIGKVRNLSDVVFNPKRFWFFLGVRLLVLVNVLRQKLPTAQNGSEDANKAVPGRKGDPNTLS